MRTVTSPRRPSGMARARVGDQVHHHLLQLARRGVHVRRPQVVDLDRGVARHRGRDPAHRGGHHVAQPHPGAHGVGAAEERQVLHDAGNAVPAHLGVEEGLDHLVEVPGQGLPVDRRPLPEPVGGGAQVLEGRGQAAERAGQRVVHLVGHPGHQRPHRGQAGRDRELGPQRPLLGHVLRGGDAHDHRAGLVPDRRGPDLQVRPSTTTSTRPAARASASRWSGSMRAATSGGRSRPSVRPTLVGGVAADGELGPVEDQEAQVVVEERMAPFGKLRAISR